MAEYIDREIATEIIDNYAKTISKDCLVVYQTIRDIVDTICPAVEAKPVVHAHWENIFCLVTPYDDDDYEEARCKCSNCTMITDFEYDYCPYCGAQMDEEV